MDKVQHEITSHEWEVKIKQNEEEVIKLKEQNKSLMKDIVKEHEQKSKEEIIELKKDFKS